MALPYKHAGTFTRPKGVWSALAKQSKILNLKPAKRIVVTYDPFGKNVISARNALYYLSTQKVQETNIKCIVKSQVVCNRAEPTIDITLETGKRLLFKTENLQTLDILRLFNELISSQVKEEAAAAVVTAATTKAQRRKTK